MKMSYPLLTADSKLNVLILKLYLFFIFAIFVHKKLANRVYTDQKVYIYIFLIHKVKVKEI